MKNTFYLFLLSCFLLSVSCDSKDDDTPNTPGTGSKPEEPAAQVNPVEELKVEPSRKKNGILITWKNPDTENLSKVEISYKAKNAAAGEEATPIVVNATPDTEGSYILTVPEHDNYVITVVAIDKDDVKSYARVANTTPFKIDVGIEDYVYRADTLMTSMYANFYGGPRKVWRSFPVPTGPTAYWDGDAVVWGQGAGYSAFAAVREASAKVPLLKEKYEALDTDMLRAIDVFKVKDNRNNVTAYSVYPQTGNERFFDDNVWIGIDMIDLYLLTNDARFMDRAKLVWDYLLTGTDTDGGVFWKELPTKSTSKHACSTAPRAVMSTKMYMATGESKYLDAAKKSYEFCINKLQDKKDFLINDHLKGDGGIGGDKWSYNSGQVIQAGALLYKITNEEQYLTDAQNIADAACRKWFGYIYSPIFGKQIRMSTHNVWFNAVALRGFIELYKIDKNRMYINAYEDMLSQGWMSACRNTEYNILNYDSFEGNTSQSKWDILHVGATVEMIARLGLVAIEDAQGS